MTKTCFQIYKKSSPILRRSGSLRTVPKFPPAYATPIGGGLYQQPTWYLSVINSQTGQIMTSKPVTGSDTTVNISSYSSSMYIVRAMHDGNTYSAKLIK